MPQLKVGIHLPSLQVPPRQAIPLAANLGADAVEIDARFDLKPSDLSQTALRQLRKSLDDYRLRVCAIAYPTRRGYSAPEDLDARVAGTKEAMRMAYSLGAPVVVNQLGDIPPESDAAPWNLLLQVLSDLGRHGQHVGAILAAQSVDVDPADLVRLIAALPTGSLAVDLDPGGLIAGGYDPAEAIAALGDQILHVHATDAVRGATRRGEGQIPLGRGSADYQSILAALEQRGYRGYFTLRSLTRQNPAEEIGQAVQYLRNL